MKSAVELRVAVEEALGLLKTQPDVESAEVFVSANGRLWTRFNYTSHIPCNGVEEPKSTEEYGIGVRVVLRTPEGLKNGFGSEARDFSLEGIKSALDKARKGAVVDPEFHCLPKPTGERRTLYHYHDPRIAQISDRDLLTAGWTILDGAIEAFLRSRALKEMAGKESLLDLGLIIGGDLNILQERMAIGSSSMPEIQSDESAVITVYITAMVEACDAKGSGYAVYTKLEDFTDRVGREAAKNAIASSRGIRIPSGEYQIILGPQPIAELFNQLILPSCEVGAFYARNSAFPGQLGKKIASDLLTVLDKGNVKGLCGSKGITCEGLPTGKTLLIEKGILVGLLADWYSCQQILHDPKAQEKLGVDPQEWQKAMAPRNGFRFGRSGGRNFSQTPATAATNVLFRGSETTNFSQLVKQVKKGVLVGRLWYTYPVNGLRAGDFTSTLVADSYWIENGKIVAPIKINTLRINDNIKDVLLGIRGISKEIKVTLLWAADEIIYTPRGMLVEKVHLDEIAEFMEST